MLYSSTQTNEKAQTISLRFFVSLPFCCCNCAATSIDFIDIMDGVDIVSGYFRGKTHAISSCGQNRQQLYLIRSQLLYPLNYECVCIKFDQSDLCPQGMTYYVFFGHDRLMLCPITIKKQYRVARGHYCPPAP